MTSLYVNSDKYVRPTMSPTVDAFHAEIKDLVRTRFADSEGKWSDFVFGDSDQVLTSDDLVAIERSLITQGHRFEWSAAVSPRERPEIYRAAAGMSAEDLANFSFEHPDASTSGPDPDGRELRGAGDNVVRHPENVVGTALYIRSPDQVLKMLNEGVPPGTIAIIDDSGGTLTAPILEHLRGVICAGGSTRSHLGILTREYGVPCLMNAKVSGIRHGDRIELEATAAAKTTEAYQDGTEMIARIWRLPSSARSAVGAQGPA